MSTLGTLSLLVSVVWNLVKQLGTFDLPGDILEIGALTSIRSKDIPSFDRYFSQLQTFYTDYTYVYPEFTIVRYVDVYPARNSHHPSANTPSVA